LVLVLLQALLLLLGLLLVLVLVQVQVLAPVQLLVLLLLVLVLLQLPVRLAHALLGRQQGCQRQHLGPEHCCWQQAHPSDLRALCWNQALLVLLGLDQQQQH
jgi:hypothetical protein